MSTRDFNAWGYFCNNNNIFISWDLNKSPVIVVCAFVKVYSIYGRACLDQTDNFSGLSYFEVMNITSFNVQLGCNLCKPNITCIFPIQLSH